MHFFHLLGYIQILAYKIHVTWIHSVNREMVKRANETISLHWFLVSGHSRIGTGYTFRLCPEADLWSNNSFRNRHMHTL